MSDYVAVSVAAINTVPKGKLSPEDRNVPGVYAVHVPVPDDFVFVVFDSVMGVVLEEDEAHESYSSVHMGRDGGRTVERLPLFYDVLVEAVAEDGTVNRVDEKAFAALSERQAKVKALNLLWRSNLDYSGYSPRASVKRCRF